MTERTGFLGGNAGLEFVAAVLLLLTSLGFWFWYDQRATDLPQGRATVSPEAVPQIQPQPSTQIQPQADPVAALPESGADTSDAVTAAATPEDIQDRAPAQPAAPRMDAAPRFDEVRRESDGLTVIAGRAAPGSTVSVLLDGREVASVVADERGSFAAIAQYDPDGKGHILTLTARDGDKETTSETEIILAPVAAVATPEAVAPSEETVVASAEAAPNEEALAADPEATPGTPEQDSAASPPASEAATDPASGDQTSQSTPATDAAETDTAETSAEPETPPAAAAPQQVAILRSDASGVELVQPGSGPQVMSRVALDTISYSDAGDVQLSGRARAGSAEVRVYLDNAPLANLTVDGQGRWRGDLPNVDEGIYTLRVDELDTKGDVTSRVETPFKRESPEVLAAAAASAVGPISAITVQKGATLWAIARDRYGDGLLYVRVFEANSDAIRDPDLIYPGQVFELPD